MPYVAGDILNFDFTGAVQSVTLPPGRYKLEAWGAQGGSHSTTYVGGKGGFSTGEISINEETEFFVLVGGQGLKTTTTNTKQGGGFNGGGDAFTTNSKYPGCGGGGATDFRIGQNDILARVLVAGAGGGAFGATTGYGNGGAGGGTSGKTGVSSSSSYKPGKGGTQTARGSSYYGTTLNSTSYGTLAAFGVGGSLSASYGSGGGGGWYGGGYARRAGAGGGSGFVWTGANAPSGYLLGAEYCLTNANTAAGSTSFAGPTGASETGHSGNGYARITVLEIYTFGPETPGNFIQTSQDYFSIGLSWDAVADAEGYRLYKDGDLLADQTATAYTDSGMMPDERHVYTLIAYNADGESDPAALTAKTKFAYYVIQPFFHSAAFSVNPAEMNQSTVLTFEVTDEFKILEPDFFYSGEIYSGEV